MPKTSRRLTSWGSMQRPTPNFVVEFQRQIKSFLSCCERYVSESDVNSLNTWRVLNAGDVYRMSMEWEQSSADKSWWGGDKPLESLLLKHKSLRWNLANNTGLSKQDRALGWTLFVQHCAFWVPPNPIRSITIAKYSCAPWKYIVSVWVHEITYSGFLKLWPI